MNGTRSAVQCKRKTSLIIVKSAVKFVNSLLFGLNIYRFPETCEVTAAVIALSPRGAIASEESTERSSVCVFDLPGVDLPV